MPVEIKSAVTKVEALAKIDTGSDFCVFQQTVADQLGLDIERGERMWIWTVNGRFQAFGHEVEIDVLGVVISSVVYFYADANFGRNVLGRRGWLDRVRLGIVDHDSELYLAPYND